MGRGAAGAGAGAGKGGALDGVGWGLGLGLEEWCDEEARGSGLWRRGSYGEGVCHLRDGSVLFTTEYDTRIIDIE